MDIIDWLGNIGEVSLIDITSVDWVTEESLVVWNWPGWGGHHSKTMVSFWVNRADQGALRECSGGGLDQLLFGLHYFLLIK